jgi:hypothetical protein
LNNRLALGTAQFGQAYGVANQIGKVSRPEVEAMLHLAVTNGFDTLDTAISYGDCEETLGKVGVRGFMLVTKLPEVPKGCANVSHWAHDQVVSSLARLGVSSLYGLLLHRPAQLLGSQGKKFHRTLQELKDKGLVQKIGVSIYNPGDLEEISKAFSFDLVQAPFSLVDRRLQKTGWLKKMKDKGVEVHTRSAFLQGLLLMSPKIIPAKFAFWSDLWSRWHSWLTEHKSSAVATCLAFPLSFPEIDRVVVGSDSVSQLTQIIEATKNLPAGDFPEISSDDESLVDPSRWAVI